MSQALQSAGRLQPALRLAQAISEFEASLSDQQKALFRTQKSHQPDISDVMRLTAEIDRSVKGSRRSYGPRWTNFLEGVQRFASIGDILVGGSQYLPACGAWTVVRFSLLAIADRASYMDQLSTFFMQLGRAAPRYQNMASIWPNSKTLQTCLMEYFIVVTQLCHHVFKICNQPLLKQLMSTMQGPLSSFQSKLELWSNAIRDEMHIQTSQLIRTEAEESKQFRNSSKSLMTLFKKNQVRISKQNFLDRISKYDYRTPWKHIRKCGNTTQLKINQEYAQWLASDNAAILSFTGILGSGKSVILANMIDDIVLTRPRIPVAYFFCRHDIVNSLEKETILASITRQILEQTLGQDWNPEELGLDEEDLLRRYMQFDTEELLNMLQKSIKGKIYIILDGLDECEPQVKKELLNHFCNFQHGPKISLCLASRQELNTAIKLPEVNTITLIKTSLPKHNPDIEAFIDAELHDRLASNELYVSNPAIIPLIKDALLTASQGMFLWVVLQIGSLCLMESDHAILEAIKDLPSDLPETYRRLLQRAKTKRQQSLQTQTLQWMLTSKRPLTMGELRECLSVVPGDLNWDRDKIINNVHSTLDLCGGLISTDEEDFTVRVVHPSVKQFVLSEDRTTYSWAIDIVDARTNSASIILTYLNLDIFESQLTVCKKHVMDAKIMSNHIINSVIAPKSILGRAALTLMFSRSIQGHHTDRTSDIVGQMQQSDAVNYDFHDYVLKYWCHHLVDLEELFDPLCSLLMQSLQKKRIDLNQRLEGDHPPWVVAASRNRPKLVKIFFENQNVKHATESTIIDTLLASIVHGSVEVLDHIFRVYDPDPNRVYERQRTLLHYATLHNQPNIVHFLLDLRFQVVDVEKTNNSETALEIAARAGFLAIVEKLSSCPQRYYYFERILENALMNATRMGHVEVARKILNTMLTINKNQHKFNISKILNQMVNLERRGSLPIVQMMVATLAKDTVLYMGQILGTFIQRQELEPVKYILASYEDEYIRYRKDKEEEPLLIYAMRGNGNRAADIVNLVLEKSRDARLKAAAQWCEKEEIKETITSIIGSISLSERANAILESNWYSRFGEPEFNYSNSFGHDSTTLLQLAAETNHADVVIALLTSNPSIDTDKKNRKGKTALDIAYEHGYNYICREIEEHNGFKRFLA